MENRSIAMIQSDMESARYLVGNVLDGLAVLAAAQDSPTDIGNQVQGMVLMMQYMLDDAQDAIMKGMKAMEGMSQKRGMTA